MLVGLLLMVGSQAVGATISTLWQLNLMWGVLGGIGTGMAAQVLGATVANRWFVARRGLVLGIFGAAGSAGQLLFVPLLMALVVAVGWRASRRAGRHRGPDPDPGVPPHAGRPGRPGPAPLRGPPPPQDQPRRPWPPRTAGGDAARAVRVPEFWLLSGSFFVCGATSNGLIGTHFIPHSDDHGIPEVTAAGALALMGAMNFVGTVASGWLTDRYDPRKLLACYYSFRGLSLFLLPFVTDFAGLAVFAVLFGLDYIATVPPTSALMADIFGRRNVGTVFGWVFFAHQGAPPSRGPRPAPRWGGGPPVGGPPVRPPGGGPPAWPPRGAEGAPRAPRAARPAAGARPGRGRGGRPPAPGRRGRGGGGPSSPPPGRGGVPQPHPPGLGLDQGLDHGEADPAPRARGRQRAGAAEELLPHPGPAPPPGCPVLGRALRSAPPPAPAPRARVALPVSAASPASPAPRARSTTGPWGAYFRALSRRFVTTWATRAGSAWAKRRGGRSATRRSPPGRRRGRPGPLPAPG